MPRRICPPGTAARAATTIDRSRERRERCATVAGMDRTSVMAWVRGYEVAWRDGDSAAVTRLFTEDARYRRSPYEKSQVGHPAIRAFWSEDDGRSFTMSAEVIAVDGRNAVVRLEVRYLEPVHQEYRDLWVLRFAEDGRVEDFEEWAYWPDRPYAAD
jgi:hypothetical protein